MRIQVELAGGDSAETAEFLKTRGSLLLRLKEWDDHEGWRLFFDTYWKLIYGVAIKAGLNHAEAEDVVQETVLSVAKKMKDFKYDPAVGSFKGWLLKLTRWRICDHLRKRRGQSTAGQPADDTARTPIVERVPDENDLGLDRIWEEDWQKNLMDAAIERVKRKVGARQYQIFDASVIKQWTIREVVKNLGVSTFQVYQARSRISKLLKQEIGRAHV